MTKIFHKEQGRQLAVVTLHGEDPARDSAGKHADTGNGPPQPLWEVLPPLETRLAPSVLEHPKAKNILLAFIGGATKPEIARVFGLKEKLVRSVVAAAQLQVRPT